MFCLVVLFEKYEINDLTIKTQLGKVENKTFVWEPGTNKDFMERRSDFQGATLKVMTEDYGTNLLLNSTYKTKAPFYPSNQTYLVNGYISGFFDDLWQFDTSCSSNNCNSKTSGNKHFPTEIYIYYQYKIFLRSFKIKLSS